MAFVSGDRASVFSGRFNRIISAPKFQEFAARIPIVRSFARRDGAEIFDIVQGFVRSQVLYALVTLDIPERLMNGALSVEALAMNAAIDRSRMELLLQAGAGIGLLKRARDGRFKLTRQGAAMVGVPGLKQMILHHGAFYRDMGDPIAVLKGDADTELASFWPYVFGATGEADPERARTYSQLMFDSQKLVALDTLATVKLDGIKHLADVGGGTGAFLSEVARQYPELQLTLFDLPEVMETAEQTISSLGLRNRIVLKGGSFRSDPLPEGPDAISLVRVLYDHSDETVAGLLAKVFAALPPGGRLIVSEPMSGGARPDPVTDVYFAFYTLAMRTGRTRSADTISALCEAAGFVDVRSHQPLRSYVTGVVSAVKPA